MNKLAKIILIISVIGTGYFVLEKYYPNYLQKLTPQKLETREPKDDKLDNLISQITEWDSYVIGSFPIDSKCENGTPEQNKSLGDYFNHLNANDMKVKVIDASLRMFYAPNYLQWTTKEFIKISDCPNSEQITVNALFAYSDKLLWIEFYNILRNNLTGDPESDQKLRDLYEKQLTIFNLITKYFKPEINTNADWQVYSDNIDNFEIKYPADWSQSIHGPNLILRSPRSNTESYPFSIIISTGSSNNKNLDEYFNTQILSSLRKDIDHKIQDVKFNNNYEAISFTNLGIFETQNYVIVHKNLIVEISYTTEQKNDLDNIYKILSTFKFTK